MSFPVKRTYSPHVRLRRSGRIFISGGDFEECSGFVYRLVHMSLTLIYLLHKNLMPCVDDKDISL
jgi:hypothetical protein